MGFNDWIYIEPVRSATDGREEEVDLLMKESLSRDIQVGLRGRVDPGTNTRAAIKAQSVRVRADGGQIIIDEHDRSGMLKEEPGPSPEDTEEQGIESLFKMGTGVPKIATMADGSRRLAFREIDSSKLFRQMAEADKDEMVEGEVKDTLQTNMVDAFDEAVGEVTRRYPVEKG
jgi:hypothetical protein